MRLTLIQNASGPYVPLLQATLEHHRKYCERFGITYLPTFGRTCYRHPNWDRFPLIEAAMKFSDAVIWMDADCVICDMEAHLECIMFHDATFQDVGGGVVEFVYPIEHLGMAHHTKIHWKDQPWHYNAGVMAIRNTAVAADFLERVWDIGDVPNEHHWKNQAAIHVAIERSEGTPVMRLEDRWNSCPWENDCERPVIRGFHGKGPTALPLMQAQLAKFL